MFVKACHKDQILLRIPHIKNEQASSLQAINV